MHALAPCKTPPAALRLGAARSARWRGALVLAVPLLTLDAAAEPAVAEPAVAEPVAAEGARRGGPGVEDFRSREEAAAYAFTHVNVVPMDRERVLADRTVLVRDGRVVSVGDGDAELPEGTTRIDGRGRYLIPGLHDMHAHLLSDYEFPDSLAPDELTLILASGVTTARFMIGTPELLDLRGRVERGDLVGPTMWVASPQFAGKAYGKIFNGRAVATPEEASAAVREVTAAGYDFVKLTVLISRPVYDAVVATAREVGIPVIGHVDPRVGLEAALEAGQQIEHLDGYMEALLADDAPSDTSVSTTGIWKRKAWETVDYLEDEKIEEVARATAEAGVWNTPTLTFLDLSFGTGRTEEEIRTSPEWRFLPSKLRAEMEEGRLAFWKDPPSEERRMRWLETRKAIVRAIDDAGGRLLAGSDSGEWFLLPGWALHRELRSLVEAGLSPYEALEAATRNPAEWLGALDESGTVEEGKLADLVLVEANPLEDVSNAERITGVMARGRWFPRAELDASLDRIAPRFQAAFGDPAAGEPAAGEEGEPAAAAGSAPESGS